MKGINKNKVLFLIDKADDVLELRELISIHGRENLVGLIMPDVDGIKREMLEEIATQEGIDYYVIPISVPLASIIKQLEYCGIHLSSNVIIDYLPTEIKRVIERAIKISYETEELQ